jgi:hypothetical protein
LWFWLYFCGARKRLSFLRGVLSLKAR